MAVLLLPLEEGQFKLSDAGFYRIKLISGLGALLAQTLTGPPDATGSFKNG